jgi:isopenicillin N synthase-like dioxygenase
VDLYIGKAAEFASLPEDVKEKYTDEEGYWSFGWSHGKEIMNGRPYVLSFFSPPKTIRATLTLLSISRSDTLKGSFYNNPTVDSPPVSDDLRRLHPTYYRPNVWPSEEDCPGFEQAFKDLARFMIDVGKKVARACDDLGQLELCVCV